MSNMDLVTKVLDLPDAAKQEVSEFLDQILMKYPREPKIPLKFGMMRGTFKMSDDFDEPLEDFKDYM
ncbi:type II toxin-antitoxin system VapB family antitoxin [Dyadobacter sp.]|uniref:type II toxin-antitoxin system VapB family antitoxin n=1 Tax=Dyadobacter sp. TaxID=1914288 RepID=UPI003F6EA94D